jgi:hypothetical protein
LETRRRAALLADADGEAAVADHELAEARALARRLADKIELLGPVIVSEEREAALPNDPAAARALIAEKKRRLAALQSRRPTDRSAAEDHEIDQLRSWIPALTQRLELVERMAS